MTRQLVSTSGDYRVRVPKGRLLSAVIAGVFLTATASQAWSVGLPVTKCGDDGSAGTLRSVMASAQDGDVVSLNQLPLVCSTVSLTLGAIEIPAANLTVEGDVKRSITISAAG